MPGFNIGGEGKGPSNTAEFLRAHRWKATKIGPLEVDDTGLILKTLQLPNINIEEESVKGTTISYKFPARVKFDDVELTFYDTSGLYGQLEKWRKLVWTPDKGLAGANSYMDDCLLFQTDAGGRDVARFKLKNSWPKKISHSTLSYEDSTIKNVSLSISYDWFEWESKVAQAAAEAAVYAGGSAK